MGFQICGASLRPPSFREIIQATQHAVYAGLQRVRIIEFCEYTSQQLLETIRKVQMAFDRSKEQIFMAGMSAIAAVLNPAPFFGAMAVGVVSTFIIELMYRTRSSPRSIFLEKAYELFIAQTAFVAVNVGCKVIQSVNFQFFPSIWREGVISSMFSGLIAGASLTSCALRLYALALEKMRNL